MLNVEERKLNSLDFSSALMQELINNINNFYGIDNWDDERFGRYRNRIANSMFMSMNTFLKKVGIYLTAYRKAISVEIETLMNDFGYGLSFLYDLLDDNYSKDILTKVIAYRILGYRKIKLPLNTSDYWEKRRKAFSLIKSNKALKNDFKNWSLKHFDLDGIGYPIKLYALPLGVTTTFMQHQYTYSKISSIKAQEGDYVIDAGGCWGDTALFFAYAVGENGRVYTFEFVPENLEIMKKNIELNPELKERVEVVRNALWSTSNLTTFYSKRGPGSNIITNESIKEPAFEVATLSIDDFVESYNIPRVDFIKMDIEGAELPALQGAKKTINRYKPKLAISIYHSLNDFVSIPEYLASLDMKFNYYLDHYTIYGEETILFAIPAER